MAREYSVAPLGLLTQPNKHGQYPPGALAAASNVCMRDPGVLSSLPATRSYRADISSSSYTTRRIMPGDSSLLVLTENSGTWAPRWVTASASTTITGPGSFTPTWGTGKAHCARARERFWLSSDLGVVAFDSEGDTSMRLAGMPPFKRLDPNIPVPTTNVQVLEDNKVVSYRATLQRVHSDGYSPEGPPSNKLEITNTSGATFDPELIIDWDTDYAIIAGDIIRLYRTDAKDTGIDPGDTHKLALAYTVTSSDASAFQATIRDTTPEAALGEELYSNDQAVRTDVNAIGQLRNDPPPYSEDVATFKGYTFYLSRRFPHHLTVKINGLWGTLSTDADRKYGIGLRAITGDTHSNTTIDGISATHMLGLVAGQAITGSGIPANTTIATIASATSITISQAASATATVSLLVEDRFEINNNAGLIGDWYSLTTSSALATANAVAIIDKPCAVTQGGGGAFLAVDVSGASITFQAQRYANGAVVALEATNGQNYSPALPALGGTATSGSYDERFNRIHWSRPDQPEAVPPAQFQLVGTGTVYRMVPTKDALYLFASDGLYRLSGEDGIWRVDIVDPKLVLAARNAVDVLDGAVWAYTNEGLTRIGGDGSIDYVTRGRIGDLVTGAAYSDTWDIFIACDELHHEVWLVFRGTLFAYLYNTLTDRFTRVAMDVTEYSAATYARYLQSLALGAVSSNPDIVYFELDTSTTRMGSPAVRFQPFTMGDPFSLKEFVDVEYLFEGTTNGMTVLPTFNQTVSGNSTTLTASSRESSKPIPVPRNAPALGRSLAPGFSVDSGATTNAWSLRGVAVRYVNAAEEGDKR